MLGLRSQVYLYGPRLPAALLLTLYPVHRYCAAAEAHCKELKSEVARSALEAALLGDELDGTEVELADACASRGAEAAEVQRRARAWEVRVVSLQARHEERLRQQRAELLQEAGARC